MQSLRQSMGTIKGVPRSDGDDTKSVSGVANDSAYGWVVKYDHKTFLSATAHIAEGNINKKEGNDHLENYNSNNLNV